MKTILAAMMLLCGSAMAEDAQIVNAHSEELVTTQGRLFAYDPEPKSVMIAPSMRFNTDGTVEWDGRKVESDDEFRKAVIELVRYLNGFDMKCK